MTTTPASSITRATDDDAPPARDARVARLREAIGEPSSAVVGLVSGIREITFRSYDRFVIPLIQAHWPGVFDEPFGKKLRFLTCNLYASAPYTALFCSPNRPGLLRWATSTANALPLPARMLGGLGRMALGTLRRPVYQDVRRRIVLIAAFIATIDHAFDHCMDDVPPAERERRIKALLAGTWTADRPSLALTRALQVAMSEDLSEEDAVPFNAALAKVIAWVEAEVRGMTGVPDPSGLGHRLAGVEGTIDGLIFPVYRYAGEGVRAWMYDVSLFTQMMDDWIDYDGDLEINRITPVISGEWTFEIIEQKWRETVEGIEAITRDCGLRAPHYVAFVRDAYAWMMHEVMEAMINGIAD